MKTMSDSDKPKTVAQYKSCPWRVDCLPDRGIPNYVPEKHAKLARTIQSGLESLFTTERHKMACHYSKPGEEFPCAGWLWNQIGPGNNIGARVEVMTGKMPVPEVDGPQHETFEETLCQTTGRAKKQGSSTSSKAARGRGAVRPTASSTSTTSAKKT